MTNRFKRSLCLVVVAVALLNGSALAGGWAAVTLDSLPREIRAGERLTLGLMVRQHGVTPNDLTEPVLLARHTVSAETVRATARKEGVKGHYVVDVTFPSAGEWTWEIKPVPFEATNLGTVAVLAAGSKSSPAGPTALASVASEATTTLRLGLRVLGGLALLGAVVLAARRRTSLHPQTTPGR